MWPQLPWPHVDSQPHIFCAPPSVRADPPPHDTTLRMSATCRVLCAAGGSGRDRVRGEGGLSVALYLCALTGLAGCVGGAPTSCRVRTWLPRRIGVRSSACCVECRGACLSYPLGCELAPQPDHAAPPTEPLTPHYPAGVCRCPQFIAGCLCRVLPVRLVLYSPVPCAMRSATQDLSEETIREFKEAFALFVRCCATWRMGEVAFLFSLCARCTAQRRRLRWCPCSGWPRLLRIVWQCRVDSARIHRRLLCLPYGPCGRQGARRGDGYAGLGHGGSCTWCRDGVSCLLVTGFAAGTCAFVVAF